MSQPSSHAVFLRARELVSAGWTQFVCARNAENNIVNTLSPEACRFCSVGAIDRAYRELRSPYEYSPQEQICRVVDLFRSANALSGVATWNDDKLRTQAEVLAAFDRAITAVQP